MIETYEPDMLNEVAAFRAETQPEVAHEWRATKIVVQLRMVRETRGLTQGEVAGRMGLLPDAFAEIERRRPNLAYASALGVELVVREGSLDPAGAAKATA